MNEDVDRLSTAQGIQLCRLRDEYARPKSYRAVAAASFALLAAATVPTPLYQLYRETFHFSEFILTLIFGIYAFGVIPALLVFGPLGDVICRRRVLMVAICAAAAGVVILALARGMVWLLIGRLLVGIAVGASQGNSSAAFVEMHPQGDRRKAGRMTAISTIGGAASGTFLSGILAQYFPDPLLLIYIVEFCLLMASLLLVANIQEAASPVSDFAGFHRPRVPRNIVSGFTSASLAGGFV
jgi:MFS family permease